MARTKVRGVQIVSDTIDSDLIQEGSVSRSDLNTTTVGQAVTAKIIQGTGITITSTGADSGTGDVTINNSAFASQTANTFLAAPSGSNGVPSFRTIVSADIPITYTASLRANVNISGGGTITVNATGSVLWSQRFIIISNGRGSNFGTSGYFDIDCPVSGTITGVGGASDKTATAAGIPLSGWEAIYYILPIGSGATSVAANFRVVNYTANIDIPHDWVLVCLRNGDNGIFYFSAGYTLPLNTSIVTGSYGARRANFADQLTTARTIGGVSFDGSANINLPGVNTAGNQNTTGSAATLTTARTLTIGSTGKTFNGSANVSWTLAEIGAAAISHTQEITTITKPTSTQGINTHIKPLFDITRADRTVFLPADQIIIEKSTDAGVTWQDGSFTDNQKRDLFNGARPSISIPLINGVKDTNAMIRVTITGMKYNQALATGETDRYNYWNSTYVQSTERYCTFDEGWAWVNSNSDRIWFRVERATGAAPNTWTNVREGWMSGWSGGNYFSLDGQVFGGGTTQTTNAWNWRITFRTGTPSLDFNNANLFGGIYASNAQAIHHLKITGANVWTWSNQLMYADHIYSWDRNQNTYFPAIVQGTVFTSTIATGTAPLTITSTTEVANLNAALLNGVASATSNTNNTIARRDASGGITANNYADGTGAYNVNLGSGNNEGRGLVAGYSGGSYSGIGYNVRHSTTSNTYIAPGTDTSSYLLFNSSGFTFYGAGNGAAGRSLSYKTLATLNFSGEFSPIGTILAPAAANNLASIRLPHGTAPTSPANGDMWTTTAGLFVRINGGTVGPLGSGGGGGGTVTSITAGTGLTGGTITTSGTIAIDQAAQIVSTKANNTTTGGGQIYLNGATGNRIDFNANGIAAPAFTTRSDGTKIVLYPSLTGSIMDYALGINTSTFWLSVPGNVDSDKFSFYGGTTEALAVTGSGRIRTRAGTALLPAISPGLDNSLDVDTGIFFPAADTIAFSEGGTEVMRIDSSARVGIGTSSAAYTLDVNGAFRTNNIAYVGEDFTFTSSQRRFLLEASADGLVTYTNNTTTVAQGTGFLSAELYLDGNQPYTNHRAINTIVTCRNTSTSNILRGFYASGRTGNSGAANKVTGFTGGVNIEGTGNVTDAIALEVEIFSQTGNKTITNLYGLKLQPLTNSAGTITNTYGVYIDSLAAGTQTNAAFGLYQAGSDKNYFAGNVGIGTTSPTEKLVVAGAIRSTSAASTVSTGATMSYEGPGGGTGAYFMSVGNATTRGTFTFNQRESDSGGSNNFLQVDNQCNIFLAQSNGNVGIGISTASSPSARLQVRGSGATSGTTALRVENSSGTGALEIMDDGQLRVGAGTASLPSISAGLNSSDTNTGIYFPATDAIALATNGVRRLRADATGVGVHIDPTHWIHLSTDPGSSKYLNIDSTQSSNSPLDYNPAGGNTINKVIGINQDSNVLGTPDYWMEIKLDGVIVLIPCYTPYVP